MTREDIMEMAREAKLFQHVPPTKHGLFIYDILTFAVLIEAQEREECAQVCDGVADDLYMDSDAFKEVFRCAKTIRARGEV